jgi:hypothetical protein
MVTMSRGWGTATGRNRIPSFQIQDDLADHIVTSVADGYGVLVRSMAARTRDRVEELSAFELILRYYAFLQQVNPQEHFMLRAGLERRWNASRTMPPPGPVFPMYAYWSISISMDSIHGRNH